MSQLIRSLSPITWTLIAFLIVLAGVGGFMVGRATAPGGSVQAEQGSSVADAMASGTAMSATPGSGGTRGDGPTPLADGSFDAFIVGPGGDLNSGDPQAVHRRNPADPFAIGAVDAPVVISEFSDFECPFCSRFANETRPEIISRYVDTGLVRIEWNDLPVNGENAEAAAKAGRAAAAQGRFEEFAQAYYRASASISGHPHFAQADFERFATEAGVPDMAKFRAQSTDGTFDQSIQEAMKYSASIGVNGTPAFVVGNQFISGAQPIDVFVRAIDAQLQKAAVAQKGA